MKVAYLIYNLCHSGGMERILTEKANFLADRLGYDILIITSHQAHRPAFFKLSENVRCIDLGRNNQNPFVRPFYLGKLSRLLKAEKPDVTVSMCMADFPYLPSIKEGGRKVAEFHFSYDSYAIRGKAYRLKKFIRGIEGYDRFVVLTDEDKAKWERFAPGRVSRIYNPVTVSFDGRCDLSSKRCISAGRFVYQKNHSDMVKAWQIVHGKHPDWVLDLYGSGKLEKDIRNQVAEAGVDGTIEIHPPTGNIGEKMLSSSIYLMTSRYEGFPLSLVEAAGAGLPCVSYSCPSGPSEMILEGRTGYLTKPGDYKAFAAGVCAIIENGELRRKMSDAALGRVKDFSKEVIMAQWDELFKSLVK